MSEELPLTKEQLLTIGMDALRRALGKVDGAKVDQRSKAYIACAYVTIGDGQVDVNFGVGYRGDSWSRRPTGKVELRVDRVWGPGGVAINARTFKTLKNGDFNLDGLSTHLQRCCSEQTRIGKKRQAHDERMRAAIKLRGLVLTERPDYREHVLLWSGEQVKVTVTATPAEAIAMLDALEAVRGGSKP